MCRKSLVEPGSQTEQTQAQDLSDSVGWSDAEFQPGADIDFRRIFSGEGHPNLGRAFDQEGTTEEGRESRNDYAGMYS